VVVSRQQAALTVLGAAVSLIEDHPIRFAFACLQMIAGGSAFFALALRLNRYR
jgi:hypothetical protein